MLQSNEMQRSHFQVDPVVHFMFTTCNPWELGTHVDAEVRRFIVDLYEDQDEEVGEEVFEGIVEGLSDVISTFVHPSTSSSILLPLLVVFVVMFLA